MSHKSKLYFTAILAGSMGFVSSISAASSDADNCEAAKVKEAGRYEFCRAKAISKGIKKSETPDFSKCDDKYSSNWQKWEIKWGTACPTIGDEATVREQSAECVDAVADSLTMPLPPVLYFGNSTHSPISLDIAENLAGIAQSAPHASDVFAIVGDDHSVSSSFLDCFSGSDIDYGGMGFLEPTRAFFAGGNAAGATPYERNSLAVGVGRTAGWAITGAPSPLDQETSAVDPRYAVVMFGTNDIAGMNIFAYADNMLSLVDQLIAGGVIPLVSSIPPRDDSASADADVRRYNAAARAIAQARQIPFVDLELELRTLAGHGLAGDGVHLDVYNDGTNRACVFTADGLTHGYNVRNLLTLESLDRVRAAVTNGDAPDMLVTRLEGMGTDVDPFLVSALPFSDVRDTTIEGVRNIDTYSCDPAKDLSGPEIVYRLDVAVATDIRAFIFDQGSADIDIQLLDDSLSGAACIDSQHQELSASLLPGTYYLVADTFVSAGDEKTGEYILTVISE